MVRKKENKLNIKKDGNSKTSNKQTSIPTIWNPFEIIDNFDRLSMEDPWTPFWYKHRRPLIPWYGNWSQLDTKISPLDIVDTGDKYKIIAEIPGVSKKDLKINLTENTISICGETNIESSNDDEGYLRRERSYSNICRNIKFPEEVNPDKAEATLKDGILEVHVFKKKPVSQKGKKITVK
jgi:HSP20 family protein